MSLPTAAEAFTASAFPTEHVEAAQHGLPTISSQDDNHSSDAAMSEESDLYDNDDDDVEDHKEGTILVKDKDGNAQQLIQQNGATETQDVSKTNQSSPSSDTSQSLTSQSQANTSSSHDFSTNSAQTVHQTIQNAKQPATENPQELHNPQEHAVVTPSWAGSTNAPQPSTDTPTENSDHRPSAHNNEIDIQVLVDTIIGNANQTTSQPPANPPAAAHAHAVSLPDRPPLPQQPASSTLSYQQGLAYPNTSAGSSLLPPPPGTHTAGAPGTEQDPRDNVSSQPTSTTSAQPTHAYPAANFDGTYATAVGSTAQTADQSQRWETFLQEERRYVSEARWDRFPEGSRLFIGTFTSITLHNVTSTANVRIGNLSSDRVSKREVFDIFAGYGRLAQISLKQAYGFVQYHTLTEGQAAMDNLQGIEVQGRKIRE
ncbi:nuclear polyadenylated RNA-binding protein 3 [Hypoxylon texense]